MTGLILKSYRSATELISLTVFNSGGGDILCEGGWHRAKPYQILRWVTTAIIVVPRRVKIDGVMAAKTM